MYKEGEYIVCGINGICQVEGTTTLNINGVDKTREYYLLKPVFSNKSVVYKPTDLDDGTLRKALTRDEAKKLLDSIPSIETLAIGDEKTLEKTYKELIHSSNPANLVTLIKTIHLRKEKRLLKGFKITALDSRYFKQAEDYLYSELSVALDTPREEIRDFVSRQIDEHVAL